MGPQRRLGVDVAPDRRDSGVPTHIFTDAATHLQISPELLGVRPRCCPRTWWPERRRLVGVAATAVQPIKRGRLRSSS